MRKQRKKPGGKYGRRRARRSPWTSKMIEETDGSQCKDCLFRAKEDAWNMMIRCEYILVTGQMRPCPPSPHCTAWKKYDSAERDRLERMLEL